jgi:cytosine/creatinine deaminase
MPHVAGPTRMSRIQMDKRVLPYLPVSTEERAGNLIEACVARGTAHLRTRVNIDLESCFKRCGRLCCDYIHL